MVGKFKAQHEAPPPYFFLLAMEARRGVRGVWVVDMSRSLKAVIDAHMRSCVAAVLLVLVVR